MFILINSVLVLCVSTFIISKIRNIYVHEGFEAPTKFKIRAIIVKLIAFSLRTISWLNLGYEPILFRKVTNYLSSLTHVVAKTDDFIIIENTKLNGVNVRIYTPKDFIQNDTPKPFLIYFHGGIYIIGSLDMFDEFVYEIAKQTKMVVISVDYHLAPEASFPKPPEDCLKVVEYLLENHDKINYDISRYVLGGDSAGGHAVAYVTQKLAVKNNKMPKLQVLIYPWVQFYNFRLPSMEYYRKKSFQLRFTLGRYLLWLTGKKDYVTPEEACLFLTNHHTLLIEDEHLRKKYQSYLDVDQISEEYKKGKIYYNEYKQMQNEIYPVKLDESHILKRDKKLADSIKSILLAPDASPCLADPLILKKLPSAYFIIFEWDSLKDECLIYAQRLKTNGVPVHVAFYENAGNHGIAHMINKKSGYKATRAVLADLVKYINENV